MTSDPYRTAAMLRQKYLCKPGESLGVVTYCGDDPELKGCSAIARKCGQERFIEVQFTPLHLPKELTHGWTKFAEEDFDRVLDD